MNDNEKLRQIDEAVSAYAAGAANAGDPDAVIGEVALILAGENPTPHLVRESLSRGLEQSAAGDVVDLGDFTRYVDDTDAGEIQVGDVWDYTTDDGSSTEHTVLAVTDSWVQILWDGDPDGPVTLSRDYFLQARHLVSRKGS